MLPAMGERDRREREIARRSSGAGAVFLGLGAAVVFDAWHPAGPGLSHALEALGALLALCGVVALVWNKSPVRSLRIAAAPNDIVREGHPDPTATLRLALRELDLDLVISINRLQKSISSEKFWSKSEALPTCAWKKHRTYLMQSEGMGQALYWLGLGYERVETLNKLRSDSGTVPVQEIRGARMQLIPAQYAVQKRLGELGG
jgi:hypothetical protein